MADKVEITDPYKVDPTLKDKSEKQLQDEITLRMMAIEKRQRDAKKAELEALVVAINAANKRVEADIKFLAENNALNEEVRKAYTSKSGIFQPHLKHRAVDAETMLGRLEMADKPKRQKRAKAG